LTITKIKKASTSKFTISILIKRFNFSMYIDSFKKLTKSEDKNFLIFLCAIKLFTSMYQTKRYSIRKYIENFIYYYTGYIINYIKIYYFYLIFNKIINLILLSFSYKKMYNIRPKITPNVIHLSAGGKHKCPLYL